MGGGWTKWVIGFNKSFHFLFVPLKKKKKKKKGQRRRKAKRIKGKQNTLLNLEINTSRLQNGDYPELEGIDKMPHKNKKENSFK